MAKVINKYFSSYFFDVWTLAFWDQSTNIWNSRQRQNRTTIVSKKCVRSQFKESQYLIYSKRRQVICWPFPCDIIFPKVIQRGSNTVEFWQRELSYQAWKKMSKYLLAVSMFFMSEIFFWSCHQPFLSKTNPKYIIDVRKRLNWIRLKTENRHFRRSTWSSPAKITSWNVAILVKSISKGSILFCNMTGADF